MPTTTVRTNLALNGGFRLNESADFPANAKGGQTCFRDGVLYVRGLVDGVGAWFPINAPQGHYVHVQGASAQVWEINHGFTGEGVAIMAYDTAGEAIPAAVVNSEGMASIDVGSARTGYAVVFGLAFATRAQGALADSAVQPDALSEAIAPISTAKVEIMEREVITADRLSALENAPHTQRWPAWSEVSAKPTAYPPEDHHQPWSSLTDIPATALRWPVWGEVSSKPSLFPPAPHNHNGHHALESDLADTLTQLADAFNQGAASIGAITITTQ